MERINKFMKFDNLVHSILNEKGGGDSSPSYQYHKLQSSSLANQLNDPQGRGGTQQANNARNKISQELSSTYRFTPEQVQQYWKAFDFIRRREPSRPLEQHLNGVLNAIYTAIQRGDYNSRHHWFWKLDPYGNNF